VQAIENRRFGLTTKHLRKVVYHLAQKYKLPQCFRIEAKSAGLDWLNGFLNRYPELSLRKTEPTSPTGAVGFNLFCEQINKHKFSSIKSVMSKRLG
jgi:hypothetical protein